MGEKLTKLWPLVGVYRFAGPTGFIVKQLFDSLVGKDSIAAQPDQAAAVVASFREADRNGMYHAMRSMMLHRTGIEDLLGDIKVPTLVMAVRDDVTGWRPDEARRTCAAIPDCRVEEVAGTGHVSPLLIDSDRILRLITDFWGATTQAAKRNSGQGIARENDQEFRFGAQRSASTRARTSSPSTRRSSLMDRGGRKRSTLP